MTTPRLLVHTTTQSIRWGNMGALGHANNTVYFRYMEQARIEWFYAQANAGAYTSKCRTGARQCQPADTIARADCRASARPLRVIDP